MKVSVRWLREYVNPGIPYQELAHKLTMAGLEVETMSVTGGDWDKVVVAQVIAVNPHPNADRLRLATVDLGGGKSMTVVCGAPNVAAGQKVAFAMVGARLRDGHTGELAVLKPAKIRGVASEGMVCAQKELGISEDYSGIMVLPADAPVGTALADYLGDVVFDIPVTPNRPDCLCILGIAREAAALTGQTCHIPPVYYEDNGPSVESFASVEVLDPDLCPRYCCSVVTGVKVGPSPDWLQQRLTASGMRPINNIVDATNYVMLEYGQPLHAFDHERLVEQKIVVRRPSQGEVIVSLDGSERKLSPDMLIIADGRRPVAIAGVMGGLDSEIAVDTSTVLLEAACFNPRSIRRTSAALKMRTEASIRFERGLSRELPAHALKRVTQLVIEIAGGKAAKGLIDVYRGTPASEKKMLLDAARIQQLLGTKITLTRMEEALKALGFTVEKMPEGVFVTPPWWRTDIMYTADLAEEVARVIGYDQIPVTQLSAPIPVQEPSPRQVLREKLRDAMVGCGFQEAVSYTLTSEAALSKLSPGCQLVGPAPVKVSNPLSQEQDALRTSLRANLIGTLARNEKHEENGIRLFEIGKVFLPGEKGLPREEEWLCAVLGGPRSPLSWRSQSKPMDFYDARGVVEELLGRLGLVADFAPVTDATLYEGRAARVGAGGRSIGVIGELHPKVAGQFEVSRPTYLIEVSLEELLPVTAAAKRFQPIPRFPAVVRDIAIILDQTVKWEQIARIVAQFSLAVRCQPFDLYQGPPVPTGKKSLAFRVIYQSPTHTLKDEEVDGVHQAILGKLAKDIGAVLRS